MILTIVIGVICVILGCIAGTLMPTIPYAYSKYLAIAIMAALDSIIGALSAKTQNKFDMSIFISGFFVNVIIAIMFTLMGENLNVDIYLAAIFVFVYRIFNNLAVIRRHVIGRVIEKKK